MLSTIWFLFTAAAAVPAIQICELLFDVVFAACCVWTAVDGCHLGMSLIAMFVLGLSTKLPQLTAVGMLLHANAQLCIW